MKNQRNGGQPSGRRLRKDVDGQKIRKCNNENREIDKDKAPLFTAEIPQGVPADVFLGGRMSVF